MTQPLRVIQYGLGPIGSAVARLLADRTGARLVGGVDIDPAKIGRDLGDVIGLDRALGVPVVATLADALAASEADVVVHTTASYFDQFRDQIIEILDAGLDVVSTSEELSFPWLANREDAEALDAHARKVGQSVLGTGVNPGFLMDTLPLSISALAQRVDHVAVTRIIDASQRRGPFQKKIGAGMTVADFEAKMAEGRMGHVGLPESVGMLFDTLGRTLVRYEDGVEPMIAEARIETPHVTVEAGQVKGLKQVARGYDADGAFVELTFIAALEMDGDGDTIRLSGVPDLDVKLHGTNGDLATVAIAANATRSIHRAAPGLLTMRDLPPVTAWR